MTGKNIVDNWEFMMLLFYLLQLPEHNTAFVINNNINLTICERIGQIKHSVIARMMQINDDRFSDDLCRIDGLYSVGCGCACLIPYPSRFVLLYNHIAADCLFAAVCIGIRIVRTLFAFWKMRQDVYLPVFFKHRLKPVSVCPRSSEIPKKKIHVKHPILQNRLPELRCAC